MKIIQQFRIGYVWWNMKVLENPVCCKAKRPGPWFNIKMSSYQYRKSHCGDKTILQQSYLHSGISYTGKTVSLYWIGAQGSAMHKGLDSTTYNRLNVKTNNCYQQRKQKINSQISMHIKIAKFLTSVKWRSCLDYFQETISNFSVLSLGYFYLVMLIVNKEK